MKRKPPWLRNVYTKLLVILLAITIIPSILLSVLSYNVSIKNAQKQAENYSKQLLEQIRTSNDNTYEQMQAFIYEIMINFNQYSEIMGRAPYTADYLNLLSILEKKRQAYQSVISNFNIVDLQSQKVSSSYKSVIYLYSFDEFKQLNDQNLLDLLLSSEVGTMTNKLILRQTEERKDILSYIIAVPQSGNVRGYITVDFDASMITHSGEFDKYGYLFVTNRDQNLLTSQQFDIYERAHAAESGNRYLIIKEHSAISGLEYEYVIPKAWITMNNRILLRNILVICCMFVVLGGVVAWLSSKNIYNPLKNLMRNIRQLIGDQGGGEQNLNEFNYLAEVFTKIDQEKQSYMKAINTNQRVFKQQQLSMLLTGNVNGFASLDVPDHVKIKLPDPQYIVVVCEIEDTTQFNEKFTPLDRELMYYAMENIIEEVLGRFGTAVAGRMEPYQIVTLLNYKTDLGDVIEYKELCKQVQTELKRYINIFVNIGIGETVTEQSQIKLCYAQAVRAISYKVYYGKGSIIYYPEVVETQGERLFDSNMAQWVKMIDQLKVSLRKNDWDQVESCVADIIAKISYVGITQTELQFIFLQYVSSLSEICFEFSLPLSEVFGSEFQMNRKVADVSTMEEMKAQMISLSRQLFNKMEERKAHIHQEMIDKILIYIEENIEKDITLESIAETVFMHPAYLSRICKSVTGISLGEQIVHTRINKAKELLLHTNARNHEISVLVGYTNPRAFYRIFKDYIGLTPGEFRKQAGLKRMAEQE